jgi:hypothetical protein
MVTIRIHDTRILNPDIINGPTRAPNGNADSAHLFAQSRAVGWSCLLAATEAAERVRVAAERVGIGAGLCCSPNKEADSDSSAD